MTTAKVREEDCCIELLDECRLERQPDLHELNVNRAGGVEVTTADGHVVRARHGFIATNACVPQFVPWLADRLRAERGQMAVTEPIDERCARASACIYSFEFCMHT